MRQTNENQLPFLLHADAVKKRLLIVWLDVAASWESNKQNKSINEHIDYNELKKSYTSWNTVLYLTFEEDRSSPYKNQRTCIISLDSDLSLIKWPSYFRLSLIS